MSNSLKHLGDLSGQEVMTSIRYSEGLVTTILELVLGKMTDPVTDTRPGEKFNAEVVAGFDRLCRRLGVTFHFATNVIDPSKEIDDISPIQLFSLIFGIEINKFNARSGSNHSQLKSFNTSIEHTSIVPSGAEPFYVDGLLLGYVELPNEVSGMRSIIKSHLQRRLNNKIKEMSGVYYARTRMNMKVHTLLQEVKDLKVDIKGYLAQIEQLLNELLVDELTGLLNRRGLFRAIGRLKKQKALTGSVGDLKSIGSLDGLKNKPYILVMVLDGDRFKAVNDNGGHDIGDKVLKGIAKSIPGGIDLVARTGGEEFILVYGIDSGESVEDQVNSILDAIRSNEIELTPDEYSIMSDYKERYPAILREFYTRLMDIFQNHDESQGEVVLMRSIAEIARDIPVLSSGLSPDKNRPYVKMTASMGYVLVDNTQSNGDLSIAIKQADQALKSAKASGRDCAVEFTPDMLSQKEQTKSRPRDKRPPII